MGLSRRAVSIIGSFRQHYQEVLTAWLEFQAAGWTVTSPLGSAVIKEGIPFVRFETDEPAWDDPTVQTVALHRILRSCLTYVVAPNGYVGRTTCYELGRIVQANQPVYLAAGVVTELMYLNSPGVGGGGTQDLPFGTLVRELDSRHVADLVFEANPERLVELRDL